MRHRGGNTGFKIRFMGNFLALTRFRSVFVRKSFLFKCAYCIVFIVLQFTTGAKHLICIGHVQNYQFSHRKIAIFSFLRQGLSI